MGLLGLKALVKSSETLLPLREIWHMIKPTMTPMNLRGWNFKDTQTFLHLDPKNKTLSETGVLSLPVQPPWWIPVSWEPSIYPNGCHPVTRSFSRVIPPAAYSHRFDFTPQLATSQRLSFVPRGLEEFHHHIYLWPGCLNDILSQDHI